MKITIDRSTVEQALEALSLALSDVDWRANSPTQPVIHKAHTALKAALAEPVQQKEHCLWARNGNEPCPHVQQAEPVLRYDGLHEYASQHRLNYNELCSVVRASITAPPQRPAEPTV